MIKLLNILNEILSIPYESGYSPIDEGDTYEKMAAKGKQSGNLKQGTVRARLGIPKDEKVPISKINKELSRLKKMDQDDDKKGVQLGDKNQKYYKALQLAKTLKSTTNLKELSLEEQKILKHLLNEKCWKGYTQKGMKTMFGKKYPNCVKKTKKR